MSAKQAREAARSLLADHADEHGVPDVVAARAAWATDRVFLLPSLRLADAHAASGSGKTYVYSFEWGGATHGIDIAFAFLKTNVFPEMAGGSPSAAPPEAHRLAGIMADVFGAFARTGDPSTAAIGRFPAWDARTSPVLALGTAAMEASTKMLRGGRIDQKRRAYGGIWLEPATEVSVTKADRPRVKQARL